MKFVLAQRLGHKHLESTAWRTSTRVLSSRSPAPWGDIRRANFVSAAPRSFYRQGVLHKYKHKLHGHNASLSLLSYSILNNCFKGTEICTPSTVGATLHGPCLENAQSTAPKHVSELHVLTCGNTVRALHDGLDCFPAMHKAIDDAKEEILFEMYWFESDQAGSAMAQKLIDATKRGVTVRMVYDSFGSMGAQQSMFDKMRKAGCEVLEYNPLPFWQHLCQSSRMTRRDHRKMMVVDRKVAFTGGMNVGDFWLPVEEQGENWRDVMIRIEGPVVPAFAQIFERLVGPLRAGHDDRGPLDGREQHPEHIVLGLPFSIRNSVLGLRDNIAGAVDKGKGSTLIKRQSLLPKTTMLLFPFELLRNQSSDLPAASRAWWNAQGRLKLNWEEGHAPSLAEKGQWQTRNLQRRRRFFQKVQSEWQTLGSNIQIITNDAFSERNTIRRGYLLAINAAKERITIANSYFVPCQSIRRALFRAAARGVDVRIIVPGAKTDLHSVRFATHAMYDQMLKNGISLYEYLPSVLHSKLCIIDGCVSTLGTYNLDYRSWYHNLEIVAIVHSESFSRELEARVQHDIETACEKVELSAWRSRPFFKRLSERFFYFFRHQM